MSATTRATGKQQRGFIATAAAADNDDYDLAENIDDICQRFMLDNGATTLWESWKQETEVLLRARAAYVTVLSLVSINHLHRASTIFAGLLSEPRHERSWC